MQASRLPNHGVQNKLNLVFSFPKEYWLGFFSNSHNAVTPLNVVPACTLISTSACWFRVEKKYGEFVAHPAKQGKHRSRWYMHSIPVPPIYLPPCQNDASWGRRGV